VLIQVAIILWLTTGLDVSQYCVRFRLGSGAAINKTAIFVPVLMSLGATIQKFARKNGMRTALARSMKKAQTNGTMINAICEAP